MPDTKISALGTATLVASDLLAVVHDPAGSPVTVKAPISQVLALAAAPVAPGMVLVEQHTASASAALDFTTGITSAYDDYLLEILNLVPSATAQLRVLVSTDGGATFPVTSYASHSFLIGSGFSSNLTGQTNCLMVGATTLSGSEMSVSMRCHRPLSPLPTEFTHHGGYRNGGDSVRYTLVGGGWYESNTPVNALRVLFASGTITSGVARLYGIAK